MERSPEYREMDRIVTRLVEGGLINVDPYTESVRVESAGVQQLAEPIEDANRKLALNMKLIAALEAELAALKAKRALLVAEVDVTRAFMDAAEDSSWPNAWADYGEYVTVAQAATDAAKAREG